MTKQNPEYEMGELDLLEFMQMKLSKQIKYAKFQPAADLPNCTVKKNAFGEDYATMDNETDCEDKYDEDSFP